MNRSATVCATLLLAVVSSVAGPARAAGSARAVDVVERSIPDLQRALAAGELTSHELVAAYLQRIALYEDRLNAILAVNPDALRLADELDRERAAGRVRGPLHGIPIAVKDNIHTLDMPTTGGALAFAGFVPPYEATLVANLRAAGAIVVAKTQMTELANWVATGMPTNYNGGNGYGFNPYDPRRDPRPATGDGRPVLATGGSSSGTGTAASFWAANVGTETSGSILSPASANLLVGIKPTVGRISRYGIIPITADQDTAGPMARTVTDAAVLLGVLEGTAPDPHDAATGRCPAPDGHDYTKFLDREALRGARIGIPRAYFYDETRFPAKRRWWVASILAGARGDGRRDRDAPAARATVVDPVEIPSISATAAGDSLLSWGVCADSTTPGQMPTARSSSSTWDEARLHVLVSRRSAPGAGAVAHRAPAVNVAHQKMNAIRYGQALLDISDEMDVALDRERYEADRARDLRLSREQGLDAVFAEQRPDAVPFPANWGGDRRRAGHLDGRARPGRLLPGERRRRLPGRFRTALSPMGVSFTGSPAASRA
ncbi:MAG: amidase family protein [Thermoanaerobaculia bacterium]